MTFSTSSPQGRSMFINHRYCREEICDIILSLAMPWLSLRILRDILNLMKIYKVSPVQKFRKAFMLIRSIYHMQKPLIERLPIRSCRKAILILDQNYNTVNYSTDLFLIPSSSSLSLLGNSKIDSLENIPQKEYLKQVDLVLDELEISGMNTKSHKAAKNVQNVQSDSCAYSSIFSKIHKKLVDDPSLDNKTTSHCMDILKRINEGYFSTIQSLSKHHVYKKLELEDRIKHLENKFLEQAEHNEREIMTLKKEIDTKNREVEEHRLRSKLTKQQKEALKFFQDQFLESKTLKKVMEEDHENIMNGKNELAKLLATTPEKVTESGVTDILNNFNSTLENQLGAESYTEQIRFSKLDAEKDKPYKSIESEMSFKLKNIQMSTAKKIVDRLVTKSTSCDVEVQTLTIEELMKEYYQRQLHMDKMVDKVKQKLKYEESLHMMTKEKLIWSEKDKIKLQRQVDNLEKVLRSLEEKHRTLTKKYMDFAREYKDVEYQIKSLEKNLDKSKTLRAHLENQVKVLKIEISQLKSEPAPTKSMKHKDKKLESLQKKYDKQKEFIGELQAKNEAYYDKIVYMESIIKNNTELFDEYKKQKEQDKLERESRASRWSRRSNKNFSRINSTLSHDPTKNKERKATNESNQSFLNPNGSDRVTRKGTQKNNKLDFYSNENGLGSDTLEDDEGKFNFESDEEEKDQNNRRKGPPIVIRGPSPDGKKNNREQSKNKIMQGNLSLERELKISMSPNKVESSDFTINTNKLKTSQMKTLEMKKQNRRPMSSHSSSQSEEFQMIAKNNNADYEHERGVKHNHKFRSQVVIKRGQRARFRESGHEVNGKTGTQNIRSKYDSKSNISKPFQIKSTVYTGKEKDSISSGRIVNYTEPPSRVTQNVGTQFHREFLPKEVILTEERLNEIKEDITTSLILELEISRKHVNMLTEDQEKILYKMGRLLGEYYIKDKSRAARNLNNNASFSPTIKRSKRHKKSHQKMKTLIQLSNGGGNMNQKNSSCTFQKFQSG
ncbi:unnamed protein product [Moneuplotes crassus]|uniref:Uncharacterized protein n=1 Tax=Euplotes crassus TaxID=5936 RepID=A0AAD1UP69_EUPCR|nr:unnamed protein product [Moneuplotes crassus]